MWKHKELRPMFDEFIVCSFDFECKHSYFCFLNIFCGPIRYSSDLKIDPLISKMSAAIMHASHNWSKSFWKSNVKAQIQSHKFFSKHISFWSRNHTAYFWWDCLRRVEKGVSDRHPLAFTMITKITKTASPKNKRFWLPQKI